MEEEKKESFFSYIIMFVLAIALALLIRTFVFSSNAVSGVSMNPSFKDGDRLISLVFPLYYRDPDYGDVVIIDSPIEENKEYIKRILGKPGDSIKIHDGNVYRNDEKLTENYIEDGLETGIYNLDSWTLDKDEYFVMGDNRLPGKSADSRAFGPITRKSIRGIVRFRYWPLSQFGIIGGTDD
ncbi:signal peptidase I [Peptoniphilus catoniae]|uniref:signal peptidase I n=1 Tax=Peptoniphilus catoniae TaxID=1660341 RepID=UPI0010FD6494|nr:signal peptidase I [Peptoniphilus catoniae]